MASGRPPPLNPGYWSGGFTDPIQVQSGDLTLLFKLNYSECSPKMTTYHQPVLIPSP